MKSFKSQLSEQLENAYYDDIQTLTFLGCSISASDIQLLQKENDIIQESNAFRTVEFVFCKFGTNGDESDGEATKALAMLKDWFRHHQTKIQQLVWIDNSHCSIQDVAELVTCSGAIKVEIRSSPPPRQHHQAHVMNNNNNNNNNNNSDNSMSDALCCLLESCTIVQDLRISLPSMVLSNEQGLNRLSQSLQKLKRLRHLTWNRLVLHDVADWLGLVRDGFCLMPQLQSLGLENLDVVEEDSIHVDPTGDSSKRDPKDVVAEATQLLLTHVTKGVSLTNVAPCLVSGLANLPMNSTEGRKHTQELDLKRVQIEACVLEHWFGTCLQSSHCRLRSLKLRQVDLVDNNMTQKKSRSAARVWKHLIHGVPHWANLRKLRISGLCTNLPSASTFAPELIQGQQHRQMLSSILWQQQFQVALESNTSLTSVHVDDFLSGVGSKSITLPRELRERNRQMHRSREWLQLRQQQQHQHFGFVSSAMDESTSPGQSMIPTTLPTHKMLASLGHVAAVYTLVQACAPTEWAQQHHVANRKRRQTSSC
eukprot:CAMPEP_0172450272 /NCGR_PEP_ID=MMETSP1065-20121228/8686_1 /TAXON_ID=265537 /ORGANISM="Amphiprora paludosa, Strain CCMP125" /LENGTH=536 /DNA_ID=CAMNT_0013202051 /DNA_START=227 /DNA_END=1837 /DNA_ORIENTATION=-